MLYGPVSSEKGQLSEVDWHNQKKRFKAWEGFTAREIHCYFWRWRESCDRKAAVLRELRMNGIWWLARNQGSESYKFKELIPDMASWVWRRKQVLMERQSSLHLDFSLEDLERIMKWYNVQTSNPSDSKIINWYLSCENCSFFKCRNRKPTKAR